jgi:two-component system response regulator FixJ
VTKHNETAIRGAVVGVVDDDPAVRNSLKFSLEVEGFSVRVYSDGGEFLDKFERDGAGCLVIDQNMPGLNGMDLVEILRKRNDPIAAILMTSHPTANLRERARKAGISIIEKPLLGNALIERLREALLRA